MQDASVLVPFTPFHLGPGALIKGLAGRHLSFMVFGMTQVAMDVEVLVRILGRARQLHGYSNSFIGATVILALCLLVAKPVCEWGLRVINAVTSRNGEGALYIKPSIPWPAVITSCVIGVYSHVVLDGIMHADAEPFYPFSDYNPLLDATSIPILHLMCVLLGVLGLMLIFVTWFFFSTPRK